MKVMIIMIMIKGASGVVGTNGGNEQRMIIIMRMTHCMATLLV